MINNVAKFFRSIDQFGANYKPSIAHGEVEFKTALGGLFSIIVYGLSLAYLIYELFLWQTGQILPKVTSMETEVETYSLNLSSITIADFCLRKHDDINNQIDPFDPENVVLLPMLYQVIDDVLQTPTPMLSKSLSAQQNTILIEFKSVLLVNNEHPELGIKNIQYTIMFEECQQSVLPDGYVCASDDKIKAFFSQKQNQLYVRTYINQFNTSTKRIDEVVLDYFISFDNKTTYYSQLSLQTSSVSVDTGFLLDSTTMHEFTSDVITESQTMNLDYFQLIFDKDVFVVLEFQLGTLQTTIFIEYAKMSEVLADIGSIISFFLFFSNVAYMINEKSLEEKVIRSVIEMYYPQFKDVKFKKNWCSKIVDIKYKDKQVQVNQFLQKYKRLYEIARQKLCLTNSLYETSRLQFILRQICNYDTLQQSHSMGIPIKELEIIQEVEKSEIQQIAIQELQVDQVDDQSVDEINVIKIIPQMTIDINQQTIPQLEKAHSSSSIFLGKQIQQYQENQNDNLQLSDDEFFILMQKQQEFKYMHSKQNSTLFLQKVTETNAK